jgi:hypothetical protein
MDRKPGLECVAEVIESDIVAAQTGLAFIDREGGSQRAMVLLRSDSEAGSG